MPYPVVTNPFSIDHSSWPPPFARQRALPVAPARPRRVHPGLVLVAFLAGGMAGLAQEPSLDPLAVQPVSLADPVGPVPAGDRSLSLLAGLPSLMAGVEAIMADPARSAADSDQVIAALERLRPEVQALTGIGRDLLVHGIAATAAAFAAEGDAPRALRVIRLYPAVILDDPVAVETAVQALAMTALSQPARIEGQRDLIRALLDRPGDPATRAALGLLALIDRAEPLGWTEAALRDLLAEAGRTDPAQAGVIRARLSLALSLTEGQADPGAALRRTALMAVLD
jgi:hypothetical protein